MPSLTAGAVPDFGAAPSGVVRTVARSSGTHFGFVRCNPETGDHYLFKAPHDERDTFIPEAEVAVARISAASGLDTPPVYTTRLGRTIYSMQEFYTDAVPAFPGARTPFFVTRPPVLVRLADLSAEDVLTIQMHGALDWLISNYDDSPDQWVRRADGRLVGVDKARAFQMTGRDATGWTDVPHTLLGLPWSILRQYADGAPGALHDPTRPGPLRDFVRRLQGIHDGALRRCLSPYAEKAAARGRLANPEADGLRDLPSAIPPNDVDAFLDYVVARKRNLADDLGSLWHRACERRSLLLKDNNS